MGVLDRVRPRRRSARPGIDDGAVTRLVQQVLELGIDGKGPLKSAAEYADLARRRRPGPEAAARWVARRHLVTGGAGGFVTGLGGFVTMPVALPVNVVEFYVQATRMVATIAVLRGYDVRRPEVRTAVLLTLIGSHADDVLEKAALKGGAGRLTDVALGQLPPAAVMVVNKAIGFRLLRGVGEKAFSRLGRGVPLAGGVIGGGIDGWMMKRIADHALRQFPPRLGQPT